MRVDSSRLSRGAAFVVALLLGACASWPARERLAGPEPRYLPSTVDSASGGVALVLSGGSARGYAHIGVLKAFQAHGLRPDIVVGTSSGSIVGALYASGMSAEEVEAAVGELRPATFMDWALPGLGVLPGTLGLVHGSNLARFIDERVGHRPIEAFPVRFAAIATDLQDGSVKIFNAGAAGRAVLASSAVPGLIAPVKIAGRRYVDGQVSSPLPVEAARRLGARAVIAVDVLYPPEDAAPRTALSVLFQSFVISAHRLKSVERSQADLVLAPSLPRSEGQLGFGDRERLIAAGERSAEESIAAIRRVFASAREESGPVPARAK